MNIVVCVKYVPDATADRHFEPTTPSTASASTGCCPSSTSTPSSRRCRSRRRPSDDDATVTALTVGPEDADDAVAQGAADGRRQGRPRRSTTRSPAPTRSPPRWCWPRRSRRSATRPRSSAAWPRPTARWASSRRCWPSGSACRRSRWPRWSRRQGDQVRIKRDGDTATEVIGGDAAAGAVGDRPVRRGPLPVLQGHHGGEEEAGGDLVAGRPRRRGRARSAWTVAWTAVEDTTERPPRTAGEIVKDEDGSGAKALAEFLASKKFI